MSNILDGLNAEQRKAAEQIEGPQLILAGAGSGKTRTLTHKIAYIIEKGVAPEDILAITFTNKAANEMKERIHALVGEESDKVTAKTFHSFCYQILRKEYHRVGLRKNFSIYDDHEQTKILKNLVNDDDESMVEYREVKSFISKAKNDMRSPEIVLAEVQTMGGEELAQYYNKYQEVLLENNAVDFDDLLIFANKALDNEQALRYWQNHFHYIFVDEFQDTNLPQFRLVQLLANKHKNLCVVGDDNQSIYGWRGSNVQYIIDFDNWFPKRKLYKLETNYRSTPTIVDAASTIIELNSNKTNKVLRAHKEVNKHKIYKFTSYNEYDEARRVTSRLMKHLEEYKPEDIAVLYRTNAQSRVIEDELRKQYIPYRVLGGVNFYSRKEVKDIIAYLRVLVNPYDSLSLQRIINFPPRKVGAKALNTLKEHAMECGISLWEACLDSRDKSIKHFVSVMEEAKKKKDIGEITQYLIDEFKVLEYWEKYDSKDTSSSKGENVLGFLETALGYDKNKDLGDFLEFLQLVTDNTNDGKGVNLMTAHGSKGLEFPIVFIIGVSEDLFPLKCNSWKELEEERRLFYVAITRAEDIVYISYPKNRNVYGQMKSYVQSHLTRAIPAEFLKEI